MHDNIKQFFLTGEISDSNLVKAKERLVEALEGTMRDDGYAPVLDMDPQWTLSYIQPKEKYTFSLTVYGAYVGKDTAWDTGGVMGGKTIMKSTTPTKLKQS